MKAKPNVVIEAAKKEDFAAIHEIYSYYVTTSTVSLEETPPSLQELETRWKNSTDANLPYLVAKIDGKIAGYAYAAPYRKRSGYRHSVEESVYISKDHHGLGIGYRLLLALMEDCRSKGFKQMVAVIAGADNQPSIDFHKNLGFSHVGTLKDIGFKHGQWIDTLLMQKSL